MLQNGGQRYFKVYCWISGRVVGVFATSKHHSRVDEPRQTHLDDPQQAPGLETHQHFPTQRPTNKHDSSTTDQTIPGAESAAGHSSISSRHAPTRPGPRPLSPAASFVAHQCLTPGPASSSHASTSNKTSPPPHRVRAAQLLYLLVRQQGAHHGTPPPQTGPARRRTDVDPCRPSSACGTKPSRTRPVPRVSSSSFSLPSHSRIGETWQGPLSRAPWTAS